MSHHINRYQFASHPEKEIFPLKVQRRVRSTKCVFVGVAVTLTRLSAPRFFFDRPIKKCMSTFAGNLSLKCSKSSAQGHRRSKGCSKTPDPSQAARQSSVRHPHAVTCSFVPFFFFLKYMLISHQPISQVHHKFFFFACWKIMEQSFLASDSSLS